MPFDSSENQGGQDFTPLLTRPQTVAIVALGSSCMTFLHEMMTPGNMKSPFDEVWTVNRGLRGIRHDKLFVMDDLFWLEECKDKAYGGYLRTHDKPIITSTAYPEFPNSIAYPLQDVLDHFKDDVFCQNTVSYMVAYAVYIGVKEMSIYGADFVYPNGNTAEKGGQAVAHLLGIARERKINFKIPSSSTLLYANEVRGTAQGQRRVMYGYHRQEQLAEFRAARKSTPKDEAKKVKENAA